MIILRLLDYSTCCRHTILFTCHLAVRPLSSHMLRTYPHLSKDRIQGPFVTVRRLNAEPGQTKRGETCTSACNKNHHLALFDADTALSVSGNNLNMSWVCDIKFQHVYFRDVGSPKLNDVRLSHIFKGFWTTDGPNIKDFEATDRPNMQV